MCEVSDVRIQLSQLQAALATHLCDALVTAATRASESFQLVATTDSVTSAGPAASDWASGGGGGGGSRAGIQLRPTSRNSDAASATGSQSETSEYFDAR